MTPRYLVHVIGSKPFAIDWWSKPYKTLPTAVAQRTNFLGKQGTRKGDWRATVYQLDLDGSGTPTLTKVDV